MAKSISPCTDPDQPYCAAMRNLIATQWAAVWNAVPAVVASGDPEAIHQVRVASRRLRAAMDIASPCFPRKWYRPLHRTAKAITQSLGDVRDCDVQLDALARERQEVNGSAEAGIDYLVSDLRRERKRARKALHRYLSNLEAQHVARETKRRFRLRKSARRSKIAKALESPRPRRAGDDVKPFPVWATPPAGRRLPLPSLDPNAPLGVNARRVLEVRARELFSFASIIPDPDAIELLHEARIAAKRLRYTLELFPAVFGEEGDRVLTQLQGLQEVLGHLHDLDVRIERIEHGLSALNDLPGSAIFEASLNALLEEERGVRSTQYAAVLECWNQLEREQLKQRLTALTRPMD